MCRHLTVVKISGRWKVSAAVTTKVKTFEGQPCAHEAEHGIRDSAGLAVAGSQANGRQLTKTR